MGNHDLSKSKGSASSFLSKIGKSTPPALPSTHKAKEQPKKAESAEKVKIAFRCAKTGGHFSVVLGNSVKGEDLTIQNILIENPPQQKGGLVKSDLIWTPDNAFSEPSEEKESIPAERLKWKGWYCPICQWGKSEFTTDFVRCGRCKTFVCGVRTKQDSDGGEIFECYDSCGCKARISGSIDSFDSEKDTGGSSSGSSNSGPKRLGGGPAGYLA